MLPGPLAIRLPAWSRVKDNDVRSRHTGRVLRSMNWPGVEDGEERDGSAVEERWKETGGMMDRGSTGWREENEKGN